MGAAHHMARSQHTSTADEFRAQRDSGHAQGSRTDRRCGSLCNVSFKRPAGTNTTEMTQRESTAEYRGIEQCSAESYSAVQHSAEQSNA
jgi:hypothetical protein